VAGSAKTARLPARILASLGLCLILWLVALSGPAQAAHAIAWGEKPKYPPGFSHFDYVNPQAPRGGSINLAGYGSFDKVNPFTLKGIAANGVGTLMFETLAEGSLDEPFSMYGLLANDMMFAADGLSITFRLNPAARFSNGDPVLAADVKHSYETLVSNQAHPRFKQYFGDVARAVILDRRTVRFEFRRRNHELHMIIGTQLPIFSRKWGAGRRFDAVVEEPPVASGPYLLDQVDLGKTISFVRNPDYWGDMLAVRRGTFNFGRIVYKYFKDDTARLEGFKAGEFDWLSENSAKNWARGHTGQRYRSGQILKRQFAHSNAAGIQGFVLNTRRPQFADVRVRKALALAFDFEWMNRQLFFEQYVRTPSYFTNSEMQAFDVPGDDELALIESMRLKVDPVIFEDVPTLPTMNNPRQLRASLREAIALLASAGWKVADDGLLRDAQGRAFEFEMLSYSKSLERLAVPWVRNLQKLGVQVNLRTTDSALYQKRLDQFDFDVVVTQYSSSQTPGNELLERFSSSAARTNGSDNLAGIRDPAVDAVIRRLLASRTRAEVVTVSRVLDRLLRNGWYLVPHFYARSHRVAYWNTLDHPKVLPLYYGSVDWMLRTWWVAQ
jgi:microcin C transport system substrate-binding protein